MDGRMGGLALAALLAAGTAANAPLRVRASEAAAPCVLAAAGVWIKLPVEVETGALRDASPADVLVGSGVEVTRAIEAGAALDRSETDVARIPWVLSVARGEARRPTRLADLPADVEVVVLGGPAGYEARRALSGHPAERVRETTDPRALREASFALVPLSLAGAGSRTAVDVPPIVVRAVVAAGTPREEEARSFVQALGSEAGQRAFAACTPASR